MFNTKLPRLIDGDGHVLEDFEAIKTYFPKQWQNNLTTRTMGVFPHLDHMHLFLSPDRPGIFHNGGLPGWLRFADAIGLEATVLYPTYGLAMGMFRDIDMAIVTAAAYNDWLSDAYLKRDPRFRGMALLPMQEPAAAATELRRAVKELGFVGGFLPSRGLPSNLGDRRYWPVYAEAERLGCCLSVHGGSQSGMGFDDLEVYAAAHALGHAVSVSTAFICMTTYGVFERFPKARFGFLEAGIGWFVMAVERLASSYSQLPPSDPHGRYMKLAPGESAADRIMQHIKAGRVFIGVSGAEPSLGWAVKSFGSDPFLFTTDFQHETTIESCKRDVNGILENEAFTWEDKQAILFKNAERFYGLNTTVSS